MSVIGHSLEISTKICRRKFSFLISHLTIIFFQVNLRPYLCFCGCNMWSMFSILEESENYLGGCELNKKFESTDDRFRMSCFIINSCSWMFFFNNCASDLSQYRIILFCVCCLAICCFNATCVFWLICL